MRRIYRAVAALEKLNPNHLIYIIEITFTKLTPPIASTITLEYRYTRYTINFEDIPDYKTLFEKMRQTLGIMPDEEE